MVIRFRQLAMAGFLMLWAVSGMAQAPSPAPAPIQLALVRLTKLLYDVGEPVVGQVTVKNASKAPQTVTVRAWLEWQLDLRTKPQEVKLTVEPEKTATATFTWERLGEQFGYAFKAEVLQRTQAIAKGEDYFQITDNLWKTGLIAAMGGRNKNPGYVEDLRKQYYNVFEVFFWPPDDFLEMTPDKNFWYSGQARYPGVKEGMVTDAWGDIYGLKDLIALAHRNGIRAVTYAKLTGGGPTGFEAVRRHPEIAWQSGGVLSVSPDAETLAKWDDRTVRELPSSWLPVDYDMNDPKVVDIGIKELSDSATMFGWDGARWDGNFSVRSEDYDLDGHLVERLTSAQRDARNAENMRRTKAAITRVHPKYVYGYNYYWGGSITSNVLSSPRETMELCRGGGLVMNEWIRQAHDVNHALHSWSRYAETLVDDVERIKRMGGYLGPILDLRGTDADSQYKCVFTFAAGAHSYYGHLWGAFMTRYGFFCWDPALHQVALPETTVSVAGNVWWNKWVFSRTLSPTKRQVIVHLINPPTAASVGEQKELPPPQKDVQVLYYPTSQPGWRLQRVTRLQVGKVSSEELPARDQLGVIQVTVPEVALWNILVFDLVKEAR